MQMSEKNTATSWVDPDDAPKWTREVFERAELRDGDTVIREAAGTLTRRGRPKSDNPKRQLTIRLDQAVVDYYRASGVGWQARINATLRKEAGI